MAKFLIGGQTDKQIDRKTYRVGWGYLDLGQFGSLFDNLSFFPYINSEKVDSIRVNNNFMELVPNHHTEMVLQQLQQLQHQLKFGYFE